MAVVKAWNLFNVRPTPLHQGADAIELDRCGNYYIYLLDRFSTEILKFYK